MQKDRIGELVVRKGPMKSGKTDASITEARLNTIAELGVQIFKPIIATREEKEEEVVSRNGSSYPATPINNSEDIIFKLNLETRRVIVEEVQFLDDKDEEGNFKILDVFDALNKSGIDVTCSGLGTDFKRVTFGPMGDLLARATEIVVYEAICTDKTEGEICRQPASWTQRYADGNPANVDDSTVLVGDQEQGYDVRCSRHHKIGDEPQNPYLDQLREILNKQ